MQAAIKMEALQGIEMGMSHIPRQDSLLAF
jgi:hypothetical protein